MDCPLVRRMEGGGGGSCRGGGLGGALGRKLVSGCMRKPGGMEMTESES